MSENIILAVLMLLLRTCIKLTIFKKLVPYSLVFLTSWQFEYVHEFMLMSLLLLSDFYKCKILSSSKFIYSDISISKYRPVILVLLIKNTMVEGAHKIWMFYEFTKQYIMYQKECITQYSIILVTYILNTCDVQVYIFDSIVIHF